MHLILKGQDVAFRIMLCSEQHVRPRRKSGADRVQLKNKYGKLRNYRHNYPHKW